MSIRSEAMATRYRGELSYQLQDILHRNGMRAQVALVEDKYVLIVQGHDSPVLEYPTYVFRISKQPKITRNIQA